MLNRRDVHKLLKKQSDDIVFFVLSEQKAVIGCCIAGAGKEFRPFVID